MRATLNDLLGAKGVSEPLREAVKVLIRRLEAAEKLNAGWLKANAPGGWIDDLRAKAAESESLREGLKRMCLDEDAGAKEAKVLRAKIAEMEKQEPVAWIRVAKSWDKQPVTVLCGKEHPEAKPVYLAQGAKGELK